METKLSLLLRRYKNITAPQSAVKKVVIEVISEVLGVNLSPEKIEYNNHTLFVKVDSSLKTKILLNKKSILDKVESRLGSEYPNKII